jgi:hypothetical protein
MTIKGHMTQMRTLLCATALAVVITGVTGSLDNALAGSTTAGGQASLPITCGSNCGKGAIATNSCLGWVHYCETQNKVPVKDAHGIPVQPPQFHYYLMLSSVVNVGSVIMPTNPAPRTDKIVGNWSTPISQSWQVIEQELEQAALATPVQGSSCTLGDGVVNEYAQDVCNMTWTGTGVPVGTISDTGNAGGGTMALQ